MKRVLLFCIGQPDIGETFANEIHSKWLRAKDGHGIFHLMGRRPGIDLGTANTLVYMRGKRNRDPRAIRGSGPKRPKRERIWPWAQEAKK